jgi:polar amino acid transport system substrate-binding protein
VSTIADETDVARSALLSGNALRVAFNLSNTLLVGKRNGKGSLEGVAPALAERLAASLGASPEFVCYDSPGQIIDDAEREVWSLTFIGADPSRAASTVFSEPYAGIEATYLVAAHSTLDEIQKVDAPGHRIASFRGSAYDLWLQKNLRHSVVVHADTPAGAAELFWADRLDALAGLRVQLDPEGAQHPGSRVLDGCFMTVRQAIGIPRTRSAALSYINGFMRRMKDSGELRDLIESTSARGLTLNAYP